MPTTYYISPSGSDSNNGLGPDASAATNKPFLTLGKVLVTGSPVVAGDTVYVAPGYYYSAGNHTVLGSISSAGSPVQIIGDPTNAQGFKDGSSVSLAPGIPWVTTRTSGEGLDSPIASTNNMFNCTTNDPSGLQFSYLAIEVLATSASIWNCDLNAGTDNVFSDCILIGFNIINTTNTAATAGRNHIVRRCVIYGLNLLNITSSTAAATANADLNILFTKNLCIGCRPFTNAAAVSASGGNLGGGITYSYNTFISCATAATVASRVSTTTPITVTGNIIIGSGALLSAGTSGQIIDGGYNRIFNFSGTAAYSSVTQAGTSFIGVAPNLIQPHLVNWGLEMPYRQLLAWSDAAASGQRFSGGADATADLSNRTPAPWGGGPSIGCQQSLNIVEDTSSAVTGGGANSAKITGQGEISIFMAVDAVASVVSVVTVSTSYGGTNYPQMIIVANPAIGVSANTQTASDGTVQTLTSASFTPTAKGVVEVRLISRSTSTTSFTYFDTMLIPAGDGFFDHWRSNRPLVTRTPVIVSIGNAG